MSALITHHADGLGYKDDGIDHYSDDGSDASQEEGTSDQPGKPAMQQGEKWVHNL